MKQVINAMKSQEVNFQKSQKLLASLAGQEFEADNSPYGVYATRHWNRMNSYWMFWIGCVRGARSVSSFCDFRKMTFRDLTVLFSFLMRENLVFQIFLLKSIKAYLCPNIIHFNGVDFSERRPEQEISFFWRSVYFCNVWIHIIKLLLL